VLLLLGLYFLETLLTGEIAFYINERYNWLAAFGGVMFLVLGVVTLVPLLSEGLDAREQKQQNVDDMLRAAVKPAPMMHGGVPGWPVLAIIAFPLALGVLIPARPLGAAAITGGSVATSLSVAPGGAETTFGIAPGQRNVLDWVRAFSAANSAEEFSGQAADVVGFVYRDARFDERREMMISRFIVSCCVADALAIGVIVESDSAVEWQQDSWVRVRGSFQVREFDGQRTPILVAESIEPTTMPDRPYLFP
jgi:uncharacterized repeat protein (TIGR03943 family)